MANFDAGSTGKISGKLIPKIATSASNALHSEFLNSSQSLINNDNLEYLIRDDGSVAIKNNGTIIGFTTVEAIWGTDGSRQDLNGKTEEEIMAAAAEELKYVNKIPDYTTREKIKQRVKEKYGLTDEQIETILTTPVKPSDAVADAAEGNKPGNSDAMEPDSIDADVEEPASTEEMEGEIPEEEVPDPPITVEDDDIKTTAEDFHDGSHPWMEHYLGYDTERMETMDYVYQYLKEQGFNDVQIAGIMGCMLAESGFDGNSKNPDSTAKGLCQWLENRYPDSWDIDTQLDHLMKEYLEEWTDAKGNPVVVHYQDKTENVSEAAVNWLYWFEGYDVRSSTTLAPTNNLEDTNPNWDVHIKCAQEMYDYIMNHYH